MNKLYRILDDFSIEDRWHLRAPETEDGRELDARDFLSCHRYDGLAPLKVRLRRTGAPLQFTFGDFDMPVVSNQLHDALAEMYQDGLQFVPTAIEGTNETHWILNVLQCHNCVDEQGSEFMRWTADDSRPDKIGQYRMFVKLMVNEEATCGTPIFRIDGWKTALIVSDDVKRTLERGGCRGIRFEPVN